MQAQERETAAGNNRTRVFTPTKNRPTSSDCYGTFSPRACPQWATVTISARRSRSRVAFAVSGSDRTGSAPRGHSTGEVMRSLSA